MCLDGIAVSPCVYVGIHIPSQGVCVCVPVGREHRSTVSCVRKFVCPWPNLLCLDISINMSFMSSSWRQRWCMCVSTSCVPLSVRGAGPSIHPFPLHRGLRPVAAVGSSSSSKHPAQPPWISMLFPEGDFPPHPPFPLAHSAFPHQGPAAPSSFLLNHLLTLKSKPILV